MPTTPGTVAITTKKDIELPLRHLMFGRRFNPDALRQNCTGARYNPLAPLQTDDEGTAPSNPPRGDIR